jgi:hypothetical protein
MDSDVTIYHILIRIRYEYKSYHIWTQNKYALLYALLSIVLVGEKICY